MNMFKVNRQTDGLTTDDKRSKTLTFTYAFSLWRGEELKTREYCEGVGVYSVIENGHSGGKITPKHKEWMDGHKLLLLPLYRQIERTVVCFVILLKDQSFTFLKEYSSRSVALRS